MLLILTEPNSYGCHTSIHTQLLQQVILQEVTGLTAYFAEASTFAQINLAHKQHVNLKEG